MVGPEAACEAAGGTCRLRFLLVVVAVLAAFFLLQECLTGGRGLRADYGFLRADGRRESVTTQIDPFVWLPREAAFYPPYLRRWDGARFGFPAARPQLDVEWTGLLDVTRGGRRTFVVAASGEARLEIGSLVLEASDATQSDGAQFASGSYAVRIHFREGKQKPALKVGEVLDDGRIKPLAWRLRADTATNLERRRRSLMAAVVLLGSLAGAAALSRGRAGRRSGSFPWARIAVVALVVLNFGLRLYDRAAVPSYTETADEYYHAWVGWSLLHGTAPVGWSWAPAYGQPDVRLFFGEPYPIVTPFLDHPPLSPILSSLVGSIAAAVTGRPELSGHFPFDAPPIESLRVCPILFSAIALLLMLRLGLRLFGTETALAAGLLYTTTPLWVAQQRLVKEEAILAPLLLAALLLILDRMESERSSLRTLGKWQLCLLAALAAACPLLKATAAIVPLGIGGILLAAFLRERLSGRLEDESRKGESHQRRVERGRQPVSDRGGKRATGAMDAATAAGRALVWLLAGAAFGMLLLFLYAAALNWRLYLDVQRWVGNKPTGPAAAFGLFTQATVAHLRPSGAGWTLWMWMAALPALVLRDRRIAWTVLVYLLALVTFADPELLYGWYLLPVQPLLALGAASLLLPTTAHGRSISHDSAADSPDLRLAGCGFVLFCVLYVGTSLSILEAAGQMQIPARALYAVAVTGLVPFVLPHVSLRAWRGAVWAILSLAVGLNIVLALQLRLYY